MTTPHSVTLRSGEDIFTALRRWKATAPQGHRGNIIIRQPDALSLAGDRPFPDAYRNEALREMNTVETFGLRDRYAAVQSVADGLAMGLLTEDGAGIDAGPLVEALRRRAVG